MIQKEFRQAVDEATSLCSDYFTDRLISIYITGSVTTNEAILYESDLDYFVFLIDDVSEDDKLWLLRTEKCIESKYPIINGVHLNINSLEYLKKDNFARFIIKYNSVLYKGMDSISIIESEGLKTLLPDKTTSKSRLNFARKCLEDALNGICPQCLDKIPENTFLAARKFARYFVLVEGTYLLMAKGKFETFKQEPVIEGLKKITNGYDDFLDLSLEIIKKPLEMKITHNDYIIMVSGFTKWIFDEIERS